jgi:hypothetical protein
MKQIEGFPLDVAQMNWEPINSLAEFFFWRILLLSQVLRVGKSATSPSKISQTFSKSSSKFFFCGECPKTFIFLSSFFSPHFPKSLLKFLRINNRISGHSQRQPDSLSLQI